MRILSLLLLLSVGIPSFSNTNPGIAEKTAGMKKFDGYFNYFYDEKTDKIWLVVDKLDQEFLYVNSLSAGIGSNDIGLDRAQLGDTRIVTFIKAGPKILLKEPNYRYRAISENEKEKAAVRDAFASSIIWSFKVEEEENGKVLIDFTPFLLRDAHGVANTLRNSQQGSYTLDGNRSFLYLDRTKNFPKNSEFESELTFSGDPRGGNIRSVTPSPESVTVRTHHSLVELPDNNYTPREFDPRSGAFSISYYDYATPISEPIVKQFAVRHRLEKKDPSAAISEAVDPIIYYLDPGTPEPIRSALLEGTSWWDQAFESAGYKNAFQIKMLPDDADPMDLRYNVINWVHRSTRGWSYGSTVTDPRTGEIIKGHVSLGSLRVRQDFLIAEGLLAPYADGNTVPREMEEMALARLRQLAAHEVGHTIGFAHSYASSTENRASVMDYPHPLAEIKNGKIVLDNAYDNKIGEWDKITVQWAYQDFPEGTNEKQALEEIIQKGLEKGLTFLTDQDARPAGSGHPYAHLWDNGRNVADELNRVLEIRKLALQQFGENNIRNGVPYSNLEEVLVPLYYFHRYQTEATIKLVGGINYRNATRGDGQLITEFVDPAVQRQALNALIKTLTPEVLSLPEHVIKMIPPRSFGSRRTRETVNARTGVAFDAIGAAEASAGFTLSFFLHPERAARLVEFHARNSSNPSLSEVLETLIGGTIKSTRLTGLDGEIQRMVDQELLMHLFQLGANEESSTQTKAEVNFSIHQLAKWLEKKAKNESNTAEKANWQSLQMQIKLYYSNPEKMVIEQPMPMPDGSPIGMEQYCTFEN